MTHVDRFAEDYLSGLHLYGNDFSLEEIRKWYEDEQEGYANLGNKDKLAYNYQYSEMDKLFGYRYIDKSIKFSNVLGLGSAYGHEFLPIINQIENLTIVEPSEKLRSDKLCDLVPTYVKPELNGKLNFKDNTFDLIVSFSVLHHIPNVSFVMEELYRVLKPNGIILIREPIVTMGDWRKPRKGLTKNERGIPKSFFEIFIQYHSLEIISKKYCDSAFMYKILGKLFGIKHNSKFYQTLDSYISFIFSWNYIYHRTKLFHKIAPASIFLVLQKNQ